MKNSYKWLLIFVFLLCFVIPTPSFANVTQADYPMPPEKRGKEMFWIFCECVQTAKVKPDLKSKVVFKAKNKYIPVYSTTQNWFKVKHKSGYAYIYHKNANKLPANRVAKQISKEYQIMQDINKSDENSSSLFIRSKTAQHYYDEWDKGARYVWIMEDKKEVTTIYKILGVLYPNLTSKEIKYYTDKTLKNKNDMSYPPLKKKTKNGKEEYFFSQAVLMGEFKVELEKNN